MAAKKDKGGIEALRTDVQALSDAFWVFKDAMLTDAAVRQAEAQQEFDTFELAGDFSAVTETDMTDAAALMAAIGHPQRLRMTVMLAQNAVSVAELVEQLGLKTTGAAYHHLNVLTNHGIATQPQRGIFALSEAQAPRVHQLLNALFGVTSANTPTADKPSKKKKSKS